LNCDFARIFCMNGTAPMSAPAKNTGTQSVHAPLFTAQSTLAPHKMTAQTDEATLLSVAPRVLREM